MTNLPQIQPHNTLIQAVNARELHEFLQNKRQFSDWIKQRISEYDFVENQDFVSFSQNCEKPKGGRPTTEYAITLDMAKELSMVERNEQGKMARRYFIECERIARQVMTAPVPVHPTTPTLSKADFAILQTVVRDLSAQMAYPKASEMAIWARLRAVCDVSSIHNIRYSDMWTVQGELSRIGRILRPYADFRKSTEKTLIKRICLGDHSAVWEAVKEMDDTADGFSLLADDKAFCALERLALGASHE
ncbi:repressor [Moraxella bovoculi]|uniref:Repressor n=1 Tax=Moraxella bovoculi TaxID=386891 RepID=A0AAC8PXE9_9GAMM|nr:phage antirepressor protein [Moraxella bovoculi]AKG08409.1 repressor [Moraxella bovoculi]